MARAKQICFDRLLQRDLHRQQQTRMVGGRARAISPMGKQWVNGSTIKIRLTGGSAADRSLVEQIAPRWTEHANLRFQFTDDPRAEIRVSFDEGDGAWSYIGLDNKGIPLHAATLNLGWVDQGVILHEFGHMIGLAHEHSNPAGGIQWNEEEVIRDLSGPPNYWDEPTIRHNVLDKYSVDQIYGTEFDRDSIMLYAFPATWTIGGEATHENSDLSKLDKNFVRSEKMYPQRGTPEERAVDLQLDLPKDAAIEKAGEEDLFRFRVEKGGDYRVETQGSTDVVLSLFGPGGFARLIATDDDSGPGRNARVRAELAEGSYFVRVTHYDPDATGAYAIAVRSA
jgi:hypothetical protein